jgi:hypothetical protein
MSFEYPLSAESVEVWKVQSSQALRPLADGAPVAADFFAPAAVENVHM